MFFHRVKMKTKDNHAKNLTNQQQQKKARKKKGDKLLYFNCCHLTKVIQLPILPEILYCVMEHFVLLIDNICQNKIKTLMNF